MSAFAPIRSLVEGAAMLARLAPMFPSLLRLPAPEGDDTIAPNVRRPLPEETLDEYIAALGIQHFTGQEVLELRRLKRVAPEPPRDWWPRIIPTLAVAEWIRAEVGHGLVVGNGYRPKALNSAVGGASTSQHLYFRALDLDLPRAHRSAAEQRALYEAACRAFINFGVDLKLGLGLYARGGGIRVHIDCGHRRRFWGPKRNGRRQNHYVTEIIDSIR